MHSLGLVGGTFDRFHAGHRALIEHGLSNCQRIEVWLTSDQIAQAKDPRIESWSERSLKFVESVGENSSRISIHLLEDEDGPALWHENATAILCTPETALGCRRINQAREGNGLSPLEILKVEHVTGHAGKPISSSRIRQGEIDKDGQSYLPENVGEADLILQLTAARIISDILCWPLRARMLASCSKSGSDFCKRQWRKRRRN